MNTKAQTCPCHSGKPYEQCCQPYHQGKNPSDALALMRSRYSAYALSLTQYIIDTTHPNSPSCVDDKIVWQQQILAFCANTTFDDLTIKDFQDGQKEAFVTFHAKLTQNDQDASFQERSRFRRRKGRWLYLDGQVNRGGTSG